MELKFEVIKNQKFDIGRTINPFKCDCVTCDFLHCPKNNYAVKMKRHRYTVKEFISCYSKELYSKGFSEEMIEDFMDLFNFPKGTYWQPNRHKTEIELVSFNRKYQEVTRGSVDLSTGDIWEIEFSKSQYTLACRISKAIKEIIDYIQKERSNLEHNCN